MQVSSSKQKALLVGMGRTRGQSDLPFVQKEIDNLQTLLSESSIECTTPRFPRRDDLITLMPDKQIVHFACHGFSSAKQPYQSRLLVDGWQDKPFTVTDIISLNLRSAQFAYLSACHSAGHGNVTLADETSSLAATIQMAGYPSVIGTLWKVGDEESARIAQVVYRGMLEHEKLNIHRSAECLHHAVRTLRTETFIIPGFKSRRCVASDPLVWAVYIHVGA
jgi:CHAT domain-containing protein